MISLPLADATRRMAAPEGWDHARDGICHTLEICDNDGWMISAWQPSPAEIERLRDGAPLFLHIQGTAHPVVALSIGDAQTTPPPQPSKDPSVTLTQREIAATQGFTGDACPLCGSFMMKRAGTCLTCQACGSTTGCG
ncbi:hypothetical protein [Methylobacterium sp. CM6244]